MISAIAMVVLLAVAFGAFGRSALRRFRLLLVGTPTNRADHMFDRMAGAPDQPTATLPGGLLITAAAALPIVALGLGMSAVMTEPGDVTPFIKFAAVGAAATAAGALLVWALRAQMKMPKYPLAGLAHYMIFAGFAVLLLRTVMLCGRAFDPQFNLWILDPAGPMPWAILGKGYNVLKDLVILGVIAGVLTFIGFRLLAHGKRFAYGWHAWVVLGVIATMMIGDAVYDAGEMARLSVQVSHHTLDQLRTMAAGSDAHAGLYACVLEHLSGDRLDVGAVANVIGMHEASPLGWFGARMLLGIGITDETLLLVIATFGFWLHVVLVWGFMNYLPYGKHFHVITALFNVVTRRMDHPGRLPPMAATSEELMEKVVGPALELANPTDAPVGAARIEHFTWKSLLDFYTCTECGRCSDNCPAHRTGKILSPKQLTIDLRNHLYSRADEFVGGAPPAPPAPAKKEGEEDSPTAETPATASKWKPVDLVPNVIDPDVLWGCTTCRACEEQCPVMITYVDKIVDMRRNLVMVKGEFPHELQRVFQALETNGNPWNLTRMDRGAWTEKLDFTVPTMAEKPDAEVLYWVGCAASYDDTAKKIAQAFARLLHAAGVDFAILGSEETCTGDSARRAGNELLYMMLAEQNVATLNGYAPKTIVTACPHCFNTIANEYPDVGGKFNVVHHTDYLLGLLAEGRLKPVHGVRARIVFHDSCYLGRYNDIYESPREILKAIPGVELVEAELSREKGLCCGAGGAQMWMEEQNTDRVNKRRTLQLLNTGADTVASACPFCHTMLTDGIKEFEDEPEMKNRTVAQLDVAVLLERACGLTPGRTVSAADVPPEASETSATSAEA
ncbi:MAG: (Fe-S)-binding protein [Deltaproteobacteria bacterium]